MKKFYTERSHRSMTCHYNLNRKPLESQNGQTKETYLGVLQGEPLLWYDGRDFWGGFFCLRAFAWKPELVKMR